MEKTFDNRINTADIELKARRLRAQFLSDMFRRKR